MPVVGGLEDSKTQKKELQKVPVGGCASWGASRAGYLWLMDDYSTWKFVIRNKLFIKNGVHSLHSLHKYELK